MYVSHISMDEFLGRMTVVQEMVCVEAFSGDDDARPITIERIVCIRRVVLEARITCNESKNTCTSLLPCQVPHHATKKAWPEQETPNASECNWRRHAIRHCSIITNLIILNLN
jgi:hypothetical protein